MKSHGVGSLTASPIPSALTFETFWWLLDYISTSRHTHKHENALVYTVLYWLFFLAVFN